MDYYSRIIQHRNNLNIDRKILCYKDKMLIHLHFNIDYLQLFPTTYHEGYIVFNLPSLLHYQLLHCLITHDVKNIDFFVKHIKLISSELEIFFEDDTNQSRPHIKKELEDYIDTILKDEIKGEIDFSESDIEILMTWLRTIDEFLCIKYGLYYMLRCRISNNIADNNLAKKLIFELNYFTQTILKNKTMKELFFNVIYNYLIAYHCNTEGLNDLTYLTMILPDRNLKPILDDNIYQVIYPFLPHEDNYSRLCVYDKKIIPKEKACEIIQNQIKIKLKCEIYNMGHLLRIHYKKLDMIFEICDEQDVLIANNQAIFAHNNKLNVFGKISLNKSLEEMETRTNYQKTQMKYGNNPWLRREI